MNSASDAVRKFFLGQTETDDRAIESILTTISETFYTHSIDIFGTSSHLLETLNQQIIMFNTQTELAKRGYQAIKAQNGDPETNDIAICKLPLNIEKPDIVAEIKYSEILQRNTAQEKLDFIISKLPNKNI